MASRPERTDQLVAALYAQDNESVRHLLRDGADPNARTPDGLPLLCTAVAGFDHQSAEALTQGGADPGATLPDGTTPLLRAVDLGSPALVSSLLRAETPPRFSETDRRRLLDLARHWCEAGAENELRRRTGAEGAATHRLIREEYADIEEVSLAGHTVRAGHIAILTDLEQQFGIVTQTAELVARAAPYHRPDGLHANWSASQHTLGARRGPQDWSDLKALRDHPDPVHRILLADVVWSRAHRTHWFHHRDTRDDAAFLAEWVREEADGMVLARLLDVYGDDEYPDQEAIGLLYVDHPDPRVRRQVPGLFCRGAPSLYGRDFPPGDAVAATLLALSRDPDPEVRCSTTAELASHFTAEFRRALLALVQDPDPGVRRRAGVALGSTKDRTAAVTGALVSLLDEDDQLLRLEIVYALARRDDHRTEEAWSRVGELPVGFEEVEDHRIHAYWAYKGRHQPAAALSSSADPALPH
ncbi:HEAT repeat domain-containing protein [Streptomyces sp. NBC_00083]|uniref:HEAT repeat domain-containing protein n=1 Tax=Streptomyces sp. NBC_00083 TaxID=2975647 RepID=UPI00225AC0FA|nr:HEAT repeat domain-containing protein [Streptomyces sp. NBC_00083]MCX5387304.1 HEAT repeat domain-containing protein [Streptomyces sp. NBC_00083]